MSYNKYIVKHLSLLGKQWDIFLPAEGEKQEKNYHKGLYARLHTTIRNDAENEKQKKKIQWWSIIHISYNVLCDKRNRGNEDEAMITFF